MKAVLNNKRINAYVWSRKLVVAIALIVVATAPTAAFAVNHGTCGTDTCRGFTGCVSANNCNNKLQDGADGSSITCLNCDQKPASHWVTSQWLERDCLSTCVETDGIDEKGNVKWKITYNTAPSVCWLNFNFSWGGCCAGCD
ncbi:hypothetical protein [Abditibacterium utsteinense]|uniref:hypothetical protein n=1 Tax=Abditibacterium utsteinense TaxID=1960156 RepID=UPI000F488391|nr:hypothetical protein [Abditibacterium utsteinense]